jgi:hypothetical protein
MRVRCVDYQREQRGHDAKCLLTPESPGNTIPNPFVLLTELPGSLSMGQTMHDLGCKTYCDIHALLCRCRERGEPWGFLCSLIRSRNVDRIDAYRSPPLGGGRHTVVCNS